MPSNSEDQRIVTVLVSYGADVPRQRHRPGRGRWVPMCCPFHGDEQASAAVNEDADRFICHGCMKKSEDAIGLIQWAEGVGYIDAKQRCEDIAGRSDSGVRRPPEQGLRSLS